MTAGHAQVSQLYTLIVGDTPPFEMDCAASAIEFLYTVGTLEPELQLAACAIEYLATRSAPVAANIPNDPIAMGYVPGPRWQMAARQAGQN